MSDNKPKEISDAEWREIMQHSAVREGWGLEPETSMEDFKLQVFAVKFDFVSGSPGYCGDLYIIKGDFLEAPPLVLIRNNGVLEMEE